MQLQLIAPDRIVPHDHNRDVTDVSDLVASIPEVGILQPLVVVPTDDTGSYTVVIGHRRRAAAIELGLSEVPCIVVESIDAAHQIASMLAENLDRQNLTVKEEAAAFQQLALFDWEPARIAKVSGRSKAHVENAIALPKMPDPVQQAAETGQLDLAQAAEVAHFADDPKAMQRIVDKADGHWGVKHAVQDENRKRSRAEAVKKLKARLVLDGVTVTPKPRDFPWHSVEAEATSLRDDNGNQPDPEEVKTQPGFAAFVESTGEPTAVIYCVDPDKHGYTRTIHTSAKSPALIKEEEQRRHAEAERMEALETAETVRREFLNSRYSSAKTTKHLHATALRAAVADPSSIDLDGNGDLADALAGASIPDTAATAGADRLSRMLVARWLTVGETHLQWFYRRRFRAVESHALAYLDQLIADGYTMSPVEKDIHSELGETNIPGDADHIDTD